MNRQKLCFSRWLVNAKNTLIFPYEGLKNVKIFVFGRHEGEWDLKNNEKTVKHINLRIVTGLNHYLVISCNGPAKAWKGLYLVYVSLLRRHLCRSRLSLHESALTFNFDRHGFSYFAAGYGSQNAGYGLTELRAAGQITDLTILSSEYWENSKRYKRFAV